MSINKCIISGNLTRDTELRSTASGMQVLNFGIAVNERVKDQDGNWTDKPHFVDCVMFGNRAESVSRFIGKGSKVCIDGKLRYSSWEDKNGGGKRSKLEVVVDEIEFMSLRQDAQPAPAQQYAPQYAPQPAYAPQPMQQGYAPQYAPQPAYGGYHVATAYDDEIPFG